MPDKRKKYFKDIEFLNEKPLRQYRRARELAPYPKTSKTVWITVLNLKLVRAHKRRSRQIAVRQAEFRNKASYLLKRHLKGYQCPRYSLTKAPLLATFSGRCGNAPRKPRLAEEDLVSIHFDSPVPGLICKFKEDTCSIEATRMVPWLPQHGELASLLLTLTRSCCSGSER